MDKLNALTEFLQPENGALLAAFYFMVKSSIDRTVKKHRELIDSAVFFFIIATVLTAIVIVLNILSQSLTTFVQSFMGVA